MIGKNNNKRAVQYEWGMGLFVICGDCAPRLSGFSGAPSPVHVVIQQFAMENYGHVMPDLYGKSASNGSFSMANGQIARRNASFGRFRIGLIPKPCVEFNSN